jgi:sugar-specific transcriptional regulator TrmB
MNKINETVLDKEIHTLTELGLTLSQAKVYLALAKSKFLDAQTISINSGVARPDVYRVLNELQRNGFVATIINEPKHFQAISIDECLSMLILRKEQKIAVLKKEAQALIANYNADATDERDCHKPEFVFIPNKEALFNKAKKQFVDVRECLCLFGERKTLHLCLVLSEFLMATLRRGIMCRMIIDISEQNPRTLRALRDFIECPTFSLKVLKERVPTGFGIYDKEQIIVGTSEKTLVNKYPCLWSNNRQIVDLFQEYFESMWQKAEPYKI